MNLRKKSRREHDAQLPGHYIQMSQTFLTLARITQSQQGWKAGMTNLDVAPSSPELVRPLLNGMKVPQITIRTSDGSKFDLTAALGEKPTVIVFYRGGW